MPLPRARRLKDRTLTPQHFIAYAPYGVGLTCALVYFERSADVYGWWIGARDAEWHSAYFKLEAFFTTQQTRFLATEGMDLYGGWKRLYSAREPVLDKPEAVADEAAHELDRVQGMFVAEWLFFEDDAAAGAERKAYERYNLPLAHVNVRAKRLNKLDKHQAAWTSYSHGFDAAVLDYLQRHWPLDYRTS
jgi:hypothetical protein